MLNRKTVRRSKRNPPWWLEVGTEICPACSHTYVIQTEYFCVACDGAVCSMCVETAIETDIFCPSCIGSASEN